MIEEKLQEEEAFRAKQAVSAANRPERGKPGSKGRDDCAKQQERSKPGNKGRDEPARLTEGATETGTGIGKENLTKSSTSQLSEDVDEVDAKVDGGFS